MHIKTAYASAAEDTGLEVNVVDFAQGGAKTAAFLPEVARFFEQLKPDPAYVYVHTNAMGRSEFYGSNANSDWYGYNANLDYDGLMHVPEDFGIDPARDLIRCKDWSHGYPSFYNATVYANHKNSDPKSLGFGDVVFATHNPGMKRIELVQRVSKAEARAKGKMYLLDRIRAGEKVDVSMGAKVPFDLCLAPGTLVRTPTGHKPIENLVVGDLVWTHKKRYRRVTRTFRREIEEGVEIFATGAPRLRSSPAHPHRVIRKEALRRCKGSVNGEKRRCTPVDGVCSFCEHRVEVSPEWVDAGDIRVGDYLVGNALQPGGTRQEWARLAGYYLGDGWTIYQRRGKKKDGEKYLIALGISVERSRPEHAERVGAALQSAASQGNDPKLYAEGGGKAADKWYLYDRGVAETLQRWCGEGSREKCLAEEVFGWDEYSLLELLGGWADADGHFDQATGSLRISTVNRGLALDGVRVARALGMRPTMTRMQGSSGYSKVPVESWFLALNREDAARLADHSLKIVADDRSRNVKSNLVSLPGMVLHPVREVREFDAYEEGLLEVYNISVEDDESYEAEGLVTHNCSICTDWDTVKKAWHQLYRPEFMKHPGIALLIYHKTIAPIRGLAPSPGDWCDCMTKGRNKILPDGRKIFVYNDFPRFFDISFVWVGADRTACVMYHLDSDLSHSETADPPVERRDHGTDDIIKALGLKMKVASESGIEKQIPDGFTERVVGCDAHSDITPAVDALLGEKPLSKVLSTLAASGILLRPREFQFGVLKSMGADPYDKRFAGKVFRPVDDVDDTLAIRKTDRVSRLLDMLAPMRSSHPVHLRIRIKKPVSTSFALPELEESDDEVLDKVAAMYNGYRLSALEKADQILEPGLHEADLSVKTAGLGTAAMLLGTAPMVHWMAANLREKEQRGEQLGMLTGFMAHNPTTTSVLLIGAALRAQMALQKSQKQGDGRPQGLRGALKNVLNNASDAL